MANRCSHLTRSIFAAAAAATTTTTTRRSINTTVTAASLSIFTAVGPNCCLSGRCIAPLFSTSATGGFATRWLTTYSGCNDPNPKEVNLLDNPRKKIRDFKHWIVFVFKPDADLTRDEVLDMYIKTLAKVVGSEDEARMKIYSAYTGGAHCFAARMSWEHSQKLKELPTVMRVVPDSVLNMKYKTNEGELVVNGQVVSYDEAYRKCKQNYNIGGQDGNSGVQPHNNDLEKTRNEWDLFMDNVLRFKRKYKSFEHMMHKLKIFKANLKIIDELNSSSKDGFRYRLTFFFDTSPKEFCANYLINVPRTEMDRKRKENRDAC